MANLAPSWRPRRHQNRVQNLKKSMFKNNSFWASSFEGFGRRFGRVLGCFFEGQMFQKCKNTFLAKTLKIVLPSRRNANFQEIEDRKNEKHQAKINEKSRVFWNIDFVWILGGFWECLESSKPLIFALFSAFFRSKFSMIFWKAPKTVPRAPQKGTSDIGSASA